MSDIAQEVAQVAADSTAIKSIAVGLTIAIGGLMPAFAIGKIVSSALNSIGRNPEASDKIQTVMILGLAFAEAIAIYALVVALIIKFT